MSKRPKPYSIRGGGSARRGGKTVAAELTSPIATTHDGRDITQPWVGELEEYRDKRLQAAVDWGVYDRILLDDQVQSCLAQRRSAVVSREWSVLTGDDEDPRAAAAAQALEANLQRIGWDRITDKMLYAPFNGIAIGELLWEPRDGLLQFDIRVRHARRFRYDRERRLRLLTTTDMTRGELLPDRKFWVVTAGASDDDQPYGRGLAEWLYWPTLFKRNGIRFWNLFLDKYSLPPMKGKYPRGTDEGDRNKLLGAMMALANDAGVAIPEGMEIELMQIATSGIDFEKMPAYMDAAIAKVILSQTMTTDNGSSRSQAEVHGGVKQELITADADLLTDSFTAGPARWFTDLNFGADVAAPIVSRLVEAEEDLKATADTDAALARQGWVRTDESFRDVFGEGYERKKLAPAEDDEGEQDHLAGAGKVIAPPDELAAARAKRRGVSFAEPRPLYVHRRLKNAKELAAWAKKQGFKSFTPDPHVTICYSKRPIDWFAVGQAWGTIDDNGQLTIDPGGPRAVERLGDKGAVVLRFASDKLEWRHKEFVEAGAGWDFAEYLPHVTISYEAGDVDLTKVDPYRGALVFGPEVFEPIVDDWDEQLSEISLAEGAAGDVVDATIAEIMADEGWEEAPSLVRDLAKRLAGASGREEVDSILAEIAASDDRELIEALERAGLLLRVAEAAGGSA